MHYESKRFDYVAYDERSQMLQEEFKNLVQLLEFNIANHIGDGRDREIALMHLEVVYMWIGKGIRDDQLARGEATKLREERCDS